MAKTIHNDGNYSVLMSVYAKENPEWLRISIQSILDQTIPSNNFVIVEDGPLNKRLEGIINDFVIKNPKIFTIVKLKSNHGLGLALAEGIKHCTNELIMRMDSDDYSVPSRAAEQLRLFHKNPKLGIIGSNVAEFIDNIENIVSYVKLPKKHSEITKFSKKRCPFRHSAILYKKSEVLSAGNYRDFPLYEDYDLYVRLIRNGCLCHNIQKDLTYVRVSQDFYKRRGGIKYLKYTLNFKNHQLRSGYFSLTEYLVTTIPHIVVCIAPNFIRKAFYQKVLRKKA